MPFGRWSYPPRDSLGDIRIRARTVSHPVSTWSSVAVRLRFRRLGADSEGSFGDDAG